MFLYEEMPLRTGPLFHHCHRRPRRPTTTFGFFFFSFIFLPFGFVSVFSAIRYGPFISTKGLPRSTLSSHSNLHGSPSLSLFVVRVIRERKRKNWLYHQITTRRERRAQQHDTPTITLENGTNSKFNNCRRNRRDTKREMLDKKKRGGG
jgi:hypothetical protein